MSKVGIFWWYDRQLIMATVPLPEGIDDGHFINGLYDHMPCRKTRRRTISALRLIEYNEIPRGHVPYKKAESQFYGYMDKVLHRDDVK